VLSREAGAVDELGGDALVVNPFDIGGTVRALHEALMMPDDERKLRSQSLAAAGSAVPPSAWLASQLAALDAMPSTPEAS